LAFLVGGRVRAPICWPSCREIEKPSESGATHRLCTDTSRTANRGNITTDIYADFCREAGQVREALGLSNFTELDAVFNYAYWDKRPRGEEDEE
jgi:hypothetical protein